MDPSIAALPIRSIAILVAGYAVVAGLALLLPYDPLAGLPQTAPAGAAALPSGWESHPGAGVRRIAIVGASETIGFPYGKEVSFARQLEVGLRAVGCAVECAPFGGTALDSPRIAAIAGELLGRGKPNLLVVVLGGNELSGRVFAGRAFWPDGVIAICVERASRARLLFAARGDTGSSSSSVTEDVDAQAALLRRVFEARPGRPALGGLPIGTGDQVALAQRLANTIDALVAQTRRAGCEIVLAIAPHNVRGAAPYGTVSAALTDPVAQRDADPAPMHRTSAIAATIRTRAEALAVPLVDLDAAFTKAGFPDPARFLDALHPDAQGHTQVAALLAPLVAGAALPAAWEVPFRVAVAGHLASILDATKQRDARLQAGWSDALLHLLCGNFEGALPALQRNLQELEQAPPEVQAQQLRDLGGYVLLAGFGIAGRIDAERAHVTAHLSDLGRAIAAHRSREWLEQALAREGR